MEEKRKLWYYLPKGLWFSTRKEVKDYLGGNKEFNKALKLRWVIFIGEAL